MLRSGEKSHFVINLVEQKLNNKCDYIIIIWPKFLYNKTYDRKFICSNRDVIPLVIGDQLNEVLEQLINIYKNTKEQTLIIIDDCDYAIVKDFKDNVKVLELYDKDRESREAGFKLNDIGIKKDKILKTLKNHKNAKLVM